MSTSNAPTVWFVTGSQHLYGEETLRQVAANSGEIVAALNASERIPLPVTATPVMTDTDKILATIRQANADPSCAGLILWMHTFSPAKMWVRALEICNVPLLHLHTQHHRALPWSTIDMDFMNLHQAAHGDREAGSLHTRIGLRRKVVAGHWSAPKTQDRIGTWMRAARAWNESVGMKVCRWGDNMRYVSVTDGDKVEAERVFGFSVNGYGVGDLAAVVREIEESAVTQLCAEYEELYDVMPVLRKGADRHDSLRTAARLELGMRAFLEAGDFKAFTTTFEDLHGIAQLPGLACQRLMADGYGFGGEGDWKTSALVRLMKTMGSDLSGGTSFMEDYTYDFQDDMTRVLGSHMLEICPSIAAHRPKVEVHPLGIGGKEDPVRLVFEAATGPALNASLVDLGHRFRLLVNEVDAIQAPEPLPKLPVAATLWECRPDFETAVSAWILAGGAHHTGYSYSVSTELLEDFARIAGIEMVRIDRDTKLSSFEQELRTNEVYYRLKGGI
jgi:L-arabinose isomerase